MSLNGEITKYKVLMGKYLIDEVMMGIYLNLSYTFIIFFVENGSNNEK